MAKKIGSASQLVALKNNDNENQAVIIKIVRIAYAILCTPKSVTGR